MQIQLGEESVIPEELKTIEFSTHLKIEDINETDYLKIAMKLNQIELESASEVADSENETLIQEIINPTPGLVVDDDIRIDIQLSFKNSELDTSFTLSNTLKARLDATLDDPRSKFS